MTVITDTNEYNSNSNLSQDKYNIDIEKYNSRGDLGYKNFTTLIDGKYNVTIFEGSDVTLPETIQFITGDGDDTLNINTPRDLNGTISLGYGNDFLDLQTGGGDVRSGTVHGDGGDDNISGYNIALLYGDDGNDTLYAGGTVYGGNGDDNIKSETYAYGGAGNDTVYAFFNGASGDDGDDIVTSEFGASGGNGNDIVTSERTTASGDAGNDIVTSYGEDAYGGDGNDVVTGYWSAWGGNGDDIVMSYRGDRSGGKEMDDPVRLDGGAGNDRLTGGAELDILIGGAGKDYLTGGGGADVFRFEKGDLGFGYATRDEITDFELSIDKIDLTAYSNADISLIHEATYDRVKIDTNGDHKADFLIQVTVVSGGALTMGDILIA